MIARWMEQSFIFPDSNLLIQYIIKNIVFTRKNTGYCYHRMYAAIVKTEIFMIYYKEK